MAWRGTCTCPVCATLMFCSALFHDDLQQLTWQTDTFAYAEGWDEVRDRYQGLRGRRATRVLPDGALLVRPDVAAAQMAADLQQAHWISNRRDTDALSRSPRDNTASSSRKPDALMCGRPVCGSPDGEPPGPPGPERPRVRF